MARQSRRFQERGAWGFISPRAATMFRPLPPCQGSRMHPVIKSHFSRLVIFLEVYVCCMRTEIVGNSGKRQIVCRHESDCACRDELLDYSLGSEKPIAGIHAAQN